jgi:hypothetical protein
MKLQFCAKFYSKTCCFKQHIIIIIRPRLRFWVETVYRNEHNSWHNQHCSFHHMGSEYYTRIHSLISIPCLNSFYYYGSTSIGLQECIFFLLSGDSNRMPMAPRGSMPATKPCFNYVQEHTIQIATSWTS